jgi:hypothetical protein
MDDGDKLARVDRERNAIQRLDLALPAEIAQAHVAQFDFRHSGAPQGSQPAITACPLLVR